MRAQITYHGGKTYWHGHHRFKRDIPQLVEDKAVIQYCQHTNGFTVTVVEEDQPKKIVRPVVAKRAAQKTETEDETPTPKKKFSAKKKSR